MKEKPLILFNGGDWNHSGGHLFIAAHSISDAARLMELARIKVKNLKCGSDTFLVNRNIREIREYFSKGVWGQTMQGITPERGVWHAKEVGGGWHADKAERIL
jgi:hypothetical protein